MYISIAENKQPINTFLPFFIFQRTIIVLNNTNPQRDISILEKQIDEIVYRIYGLTDEEIKIVEESI